MQTTIFYSWQSDLPNATNRGFIEKALEDAIKALGKSDTVVIDRDTLGISGSPDIADAIFSKIEKAHIFVGDVSIINPGSDNRLTSNPNVLLELGYALNQLKGSRVILVLNRVYGEVEALPFDLRKRRVIVYTMPKEVEERASERKLLQKKFEEALRVILDNETIIQLNNNKLKISEETVKALENATPNQIGTARNFMRKLIGEINTLAPDLANENHPDELLLETLENTKNIVIEFSHVSEVVSGMNAKDAAIELFKNFAQILQKYNPPKRFSSRFHSSDFDFYKFLGYELFVILISCLLQDQRWEIISDILNQGIHIENKRLGTPGIVYFDYCSDYLESLGMRNRRLNLNRVSVHADIINQWHTQGELANIIPMEKFIEADFFLFLRAGLAWRAWSTIYLGYDIPKFLVEASSKQYALNILEPLAINNIEEFRPRIIERMQQLRELFPRSSGFFPLEDFKLSSIGSLP